MINTFEFAEKDDGNVKQVEPLQDKTRFSGHFILKADTSNKVILP